jgi:DNA repair exonuclease SbcCD ATPase subunit
MATQLQDIYETLEQKVEEKTRSVEIKNRELAALDKAMAVSEERNLLAQELHDSFANDLVRNPPLPTCHTPAPNAGTVLQRSTKRLRTPQNAGARQTPLPPPARSTTPH